MRSWQALRRRSTARRSTTGCTPRCGPGRLHDEPRFRAAVEELWPFALGIVEPELRAELGRRVGLEPVAARERGEHTQDLAELWDQMTEVRRTAPGAEW